jgi:hypothetical protein
MRLLSGDYAMRERLLWFLWIFLSIVSCNLISDRFELDDHKGWVFLGCCIVLAFVFGIINMRAEERQRRLKETEYSLKKLRRVRKMLRRFKALTEKQKREGANGE